LTVVAVGVSCRDNVGRVAKAKIVTIRGGLGALVSEPPLATAMGTTPNFRQMSCGSLVHLIASPLHLTLRLYTGTRLT
jgi:hypothetical protein